MFFSYKLKKYGCYLQTTIDPTDPIDEELGDGEDSSDDESSTSGRYTFLFPLLQKSIIDNISISYMYDFLVS